MNENQYQEGEIVNNRYEIKFVLGKGAFGIVYKAFDSEKKINVAIKQMTFGRLNKKQQAEVKSEIEILKQFEHENIVKIFDSFSSRKEISLVLEFMENGSLSSFVSKNGKLPENLVCVYMNQLLKGLSYVHSHGFMHRDIKGDNILISASGRVCLADFGLAARIDPHDNNPDDIIATDAVGTPYWLAPEVILFTGQSAASDIWSLGCTIIELLTGDPPYGKLNPMAALFHVVQDDHPPLPQGISANLKKFLLKCFEKEMSDRPSADDLSNHAWFEEMGGEEMIDPTRMRSSVSDYNRKPTITATEAPDLDSMLKNDGDETDGDVSEAEYPISEEFDQENEEEMNKVKRKIENLNTRLHRLITRISKRREQKDSLAKLTQLYGKSDPKSVVLWKKYSASLDEFITSDIKLKETLQERIDRLKESLVTKSPNKILGDLVVQERTEKLANMFGVEESMIDLRLAQTTDPKWKESAQKDHLGHKENLATRLRKRGITALFHKNAELKSPKSRERIYDLMSQYPHLCAEGREFVREGFLKVQIASAKPKEYYVLLFTDLIVLASVKLHGEKEVLKIKSEYSLENMVKFTSIHEDGRLDSFEIEFANSVLIFSPSFEKVETSFLGETWIKDLRNINTEIKKKQIAQNK